MQHKHKGVSLIYVCVILAPFLAGASACSAIELIVVINISLLLHLVCCLYY
jgi:hypothetical protein